MSKRVAELNGLVSGARVQRSGGKNGGAIYASRPVWSKKWGNHGKKNPKISEENPMILYVEDDFHVFVFFLVV